MNKHLTTILTVAALAALLPASLAAKCQPTTSETALTVGDYYVAELQCEDGCLLSLYVYEESNGIDGLQRGDDQVDDTCGGQIEADTPVL